MQNIENYVDIKLITNKEAGLKLTAQPNYDKATIFDENLIAVHMRMKKLYYNLPIYLGMCILDLSKTLMYDFHYNFFGFSHYFTTSWFKLTLLLTFSSHPYTKCSYAVH